MVLILFFSQLLLFCIFLYFFLFGVSSFFIYIFLFKSVSCCLNRSYIPWVHGEEYTAWAYIYVYNAHTFTINYVVCVDELKRESSKWKNKRQQQQKSTPHCILSKRTNTRNRKTVNGDGTQRDRQQYMEYWLPTEETSQQLQIALKYCKSKQKKMSLEFVTP